MGNDRVQAAAAWLCKKCIGPDGTPWRNVAGADRCRKCKLHKGSSFYKAAGSGSGSGGSKPGCPTTSKRRGTPTATTGNVDDRLKDKIKHLEAQVAELKGSAEPAGGKSEDGGRLKVLRAEIATLEKVSGAEVLIGTKRAELEALTAVKRESKPLDTRARELERAIDAKKKAIEKQDQATEGIKGRIAELNSSLAAAEAKQKQQKEDLAKLESDKAEVFRRLAEEAAAEAKQEVLVPPRAFQRGLDFLAGRVQPAHLEAAGLAAEQVKAVLALLGHMVMEPTQVPTQVPVAAGGPSLGQASNPTPQHTQLGGVEADEGEDMDEEAWIAIAPDANADQRAAIKARLQDKGLVVRGRRKGLVHKDGSGKR